MITRKPRKGHIIEGIENFNDWCWGKMPNTPDVEPKWYVLGKVLRCEGRICIVEKPDGSGTDSFIYRFSDGTWNNAHRIQEK